MKLLHCIVSMFVIMHLHAVSGQPDKERINDQLVQRCTEPMAYCFDEELPKGSLSEKPKINILGEPDADSITAYIYDKEGKKRTIRHTLNNCNLNESHWYDREGERLALKFHPEGPYCIYRISFMSLLNQLNEHQLITLSTLLNQHTDPTQTIPITHETYQWYQALPSELQHERLFALTTWLDMQLFTTSLINTVDGLYSMWCRTRD